MTKKNYMMIANAIADTLEEYRNLDTSGTMARMAIRDVAITIADTLETDNDRFDRNTFLIACGVR
jgi:hypothetical protein